MASVGLSRALIGELMVRLLLAICDTIVIVFLWHEPNYWSVVARTLLASQLASQPAHIAKAIRTPNWRHRVSLSFP